MQADSPYGVSTFQAGKPPQAPRGGVQVLPPVVPPARAPIAPPQQPPPPHPQPSSQPQTPSQPQPPSQGQCKSKPKPPLPPKRDELTRLTTVKKDPVPIQRSKEDDTVDRKEERRREESLIRELEAHSISREYSAEESKFEIPDPASIIPDEPPLRRECVEHVVDSSRKNSIESIRKELAEAVVNRRDSLTRVNSAGKEELERKLLQRKDSLRSYSSQESYERLEDTEKNSPGSGPSSLLSNGTNERRSSLDKPPLIPLRSHASLESRISEEKEESSDSESGATADIWVRAIDSPIKKPPRAFRSNSTAEDKQERFQPVHRASIDNSLFKTPPKEEFKQKPIMEREEEKDKDFERHSPASLPTPPHSASTSACTIPPPVDKRLTKIGCESLPCSRPSSRAASPAAFGDKPSSHKPRMSAAEALGVVAKPCPRPEPAQRFKEALEFRRQSLSNLSDSKLSLGSTSRQLWSSFGECHGAGNTGEYKRHERARGQSADSRTLQRIKCDTWDPGTSSSTLSRIGKYSSAKYLSKGDGTKKIDDRPKSTCNCRGHGGPRDSVGKRTFSVEELTCGEFIRAPSSTRSSFGKSPRVTFALSEDEMGATGSRARHHDEYQSNRSQPAIGLKQTPKNRPTIFGTVASDQSPKDALSCRRALPQTTPPGLANGSDHPSHDPSQDNAMVYREGNLVSGRLEALVQHVVPTTEYYPDRAFLFAFLLSSRLFIKPHELLRDILALSESQSKLASPKEKTLLLSRLVQLLSEWSETFPYDFRDERVMSHVREVAHRCVSVEGPVRQEVSLLLQNLLHRLTKLEQYEAFLHSIHTEQSSNSIESLSQNDVSELCGTAVCLAQQLTHIEVERLSYIGPEEFVQAFAKESPNFETSFKDMKKTRNLESYVSWFNRLSYFVATEVCKHLKSKKQRVRVVEFWIETARECFNIGNFNSLMAIIAGLNMSPVSRLKRTWSKVQIAKFSVLEHQMDPSCNFSSYRSTLKAAVWRSAAATDDSQRIVIPFFSLLVKDLYFLNEGCSNKLPNGHVNFEKFWQLAKQVTEFITWKQVHCPFPKQPKVITYLQATPVLNEDALAFASFECEQPDNNEKERYKSLKAELST